MLWAYILVLLIDLQLSEEKQIILVDNVNGSISTDCWENGRGSCKFLDDALRGAQHYSMSESVEVLLSSGTHTLGPNKTLSHFVKVTNFSITGDKNSTINCRHLNGIAFSSSFNILLQDFTLENCMSNEGVPMELKLNNPNTNLALGLYNCHNLTMQGVVVKDNNGIGVLLHNLLGENKIHNCKISNNKDHDLSRNKSRRAFGGMVILNFYCLNESGSIHPENCMYMNNNISKQSNVHAQVTIKDCYFTNNNSTNGEFIEPSLSLSLDQFREHVSKGGGLSILFHGFTINTTITVTNSVFSSNNASWGGGAHVCFRDFTKLSSVTFIGCKFINNFCPTRTLPGGSHGGGSDVVFLLKDRHSVSDNHAQYRDCEFTGNKALFGGGFSLQLSDVQQATNSIKLKNLTFIENKGNVGAAIDFTVAFLTGSFREITGKSVAEISDATFTDNIAIQSRAAFDQTPRIGNGAVYIYGIHSIFNGTNIFEGNKGTGLVLVSTAILRINSTLRFNNNHGSFGGAMRFSGYSRLELENNTALIFTNNSAQYLGGAIYTLYEDVHNEVYQSSCFLRNYQHSNPNKWSTDFYFENNRNANTSNSVWVSSLIPCYTRFENDDINNTFCWNNWEYVNSSCLLEVVSGGTKFVSNNPNQNSVTVFPGMSTNMPLVLKDGLGHNVSNQNVLAANIEGDSAALLDSSFFRADSNITILGMPNSTIELSLQTQGPSGFIAHCNIILLPCPPGFVALPHPVPPSKSNTTMACICASYMNYVDCNSDSDTANILDGYVMSYDPTLQETVVGPIPYFEYFNTAGQRPLPGTVEELDKTMCKDLNRTGVLCSHCRDGLSVTMSFTSLDCINCTARLIGSWALFFAEQIIPTTLFFFFVILGNINAASAPFNAFILFSQVMTNPLSTRLISTWMYSVGSRTFVQQFILAGDILLIPYSIWNLDFKLIRIFHKDYVCFITGNNILAHISIEYINAVYPLVLILLSYLLVYLYGLNFRPVVWLWRPFRRCFLRFRHTWNPTMSIINAFATFVIVSYIQFLTTSVKLLAVLSLTGASDKVLTHRVFFDASLPYLGPDHLPYAALAIVVMTLLILPPPVLMFIWPLKLTQQAIGKLTCRCCNWHGLRTFVEAIQGSFKDGTDGTPDRRFFAGLYFIYRIVLIVTMGLDFGILPLYLATICLIIIIIVLLIVLEPYKDNYYNKFDVCIFIVMLLVHILNFFNVYSNIVLGQTSATLFAASQIFLVLPLAYWVSYNCLRLLWIKCKPLNFFKRQQGTIKYEELQESATVRGRRRRSALLALGRPRLVTISEVTLSDEFPDRLINPGEYRHESKDHIANKGTMGTGGPDLTEPILGTMEQNYGATEAELTGSQEMRLLNSD